METKEITRVERSALKTLTFSGEDVFNDQYDREERWRQLNYGMVLGNIHKTAVRITFQDAEEQTYRTEATIWSVTEKNVILKNNTLLPIRSIIECAA